MQHNQTVPPATVLLSVKDAASALGLGQTKTWALIRDGHLKTTKIGARTLVRADSLYSLAETGV